MSVECVVFGSLEFLGDGTAEKDAEDPVSSRVEVGFVKSEQEESVLHEVFVFQERLDETAFPLGTEGDGGVVRVVSKVTGDERVLRKLLMLQILVEVGEVLDLAESVVVLGDRVVKDQRVMLPHIVPGHGDLVGVVEPLETGVGHVLLVFSPGNLLGIEQIRDGGDIGGHLVEVVVVHAKGVTTG